MSKPNPYRLPAVVPKPQQFRPVDGGLAQMQIPPPGDPVHQPLPIADLTGEVHQRGVPDVTVIAVLEPAVGPQLLTEPISELVSSVVKGKRAHHHPRRRERHPAQPEPDWPTLRSSPAQCSRTPTRQRITHRNIAAMNLDGSDREMHRLRGTGRPMPRTGQPHHLGGNRSQPTHTVRIGNENHRHPPPATLNRRRVPVVHPRQDRFTALNEQPVERRRVGGIRRPPVRTP